MKDWQIIADNLHKAGWSLGWVSALDLKGEQSGLSMRMATESVSSCAPINVDRVRGTAKGDSRVRGEFGLINHFDVCA
jgi:hypothetical protein